MNIVLLGAGRPATGTKPSALKKIALNTRAMDWQLHSFKTLDQKLKFEFVGGYHLEDVIQKYPFLDFTLIPDWQSSSIVHSLLHSNFHQGPMIVSYSDTIFRSSVIRELVDHDADIVFAYDSNWQDRYKPRSGEDLQAAEKINLKHLNLDTQDCKSAEFTGLLYLSERAAKHISTLTEKKTGSTLTDLLYYLSETNLNIAAQDVSGEWAEFNSPIDIARFILGTKAETLARLEPMVRKSKIGKQICFTEKEWREDSTNVINRITNKFPKTAIVVRSSSLAEDNWSTSNAGGFESQLNINTSDPASVTHAVNAVIASYLPEKHVNNQVLIQPFLSNVSMSGVIMTCGLETGSPYYTVNFDDKTQSTESVTSGNSNDLRTVILSRSKVDIVSHAEPKLTKVIDAVVELEKLLGFDKLDIEFAVDCEGLVHIFQVRPITVDHSHFETEDSTLFTALKSSVQLFQRLQPKPPSLQGNETLFGNMPDWNPAEIIGTSPKPLAFSLYRKLITDQVWAQQRKEFGYRDLLPCPLIYSFCGKPYVDIRASLNSFIPKNVSEKTAEKLVDYYLNKLRKQPYLHDKIEFSVAITIWTPSFNDDKEQLIASGFKPDEIQELETGLVNITKSAFGRLNEDLNPLEKLKRKTQQVIASPLSELGKLSHLIDYTQQFGTLAFSHAARAGFIASIWLESLCEALILSESRKQAFMSSIKTVAKEFEYDKFISKQRSEQSSHLIEKYGHLRPGTYEIGTPAYWEDPQKYLFGESKTELSDLPVFELTTEENKAITEKLFELGSNITPVELFRYFREAIQAREASKFAFTKSVSLALDCCVRLAKELNINRIDFGYLEYDDIQQYGLNVIDNTTLLARIKERKEKYILTQMIELPSLITSENDFYSFERCCSKPNFVTQKALNAEIVCLEEGIQQSLEGKIVLIPQADPGYDWLFGTNLAGLITLFGGANSHMAIRSAELNLPAAIGVGEKLFEQVSQYKKIHLDCGNNIIREVI